MRSKKLFAFILATVMVFGSSLTALADQTSSTSGTGSNTGHLEEDEVRTATLPTAGDSTFNFYVDPERLIARSGEIISGAGTANATGAAITTDAAVDFNGVYFKTADGATPTYSSVSSGVSITVENYSAANLSVEIGVQTSSSIVLTDGTLWAKDNSSTSKTTDAALELKIGVKTASAAAAIGAPGTDPQGYTWTTITGAGATINIPVADQKTNYSVVTTGSGTNVKYALEKKTGNGVNWFQAGFCMVGAVTESEVYGATAPVLTYTWNISGSEGLTAYSKVDQFGNDVILLTQRSEDEAFTGITDGKVTDTANSMITSYELKYNNGEYKDAKAKGQTYQGMIGVTYADALSILGISEMKNGDIVTSKIVMAGKTYVAKYKVVL